MKRPIMDLLPIACQLGGVGTPWRIEPFGLFKHAMHHGAYFPGVSSKCFPDENGHVHARHEVGSGCWYFATFRKLTWQDKVARYPLSQEDLDTMSIRLGKPLIIRKQSCSSYGIAIDDADTLAMAKEAAREQAENEQCEVIVYVPVVSYAPTRPPIKEKKFKTK